jgi:hypothetical protein
MNNVQCPMTNGGQGDKVTRRQGDKGTGGGGMTGLVADRQGVERLAGEREEESGDKVRAALATTESLAAVTGCPVSLILFVIQPRYPNGFATGYPAEFYDQETAERALAYGTEILEFVQDLLA